MGAKDAMEGHALQRMLTPISCNTRLTSLGLPDG